MIPNNSPPTFTRDFWSDEVILDPYPHYDEMRALGPVVWLSHNQAWAMTHYASVRQALLQPEVFSSAQGCMMTASRGPRGSPRPSESLEE